MRWLAAERHLLLTGDVDEVLGVEDGLVDVLPQRALPVGLPVAQLDGGRLPCNGGSSHGHHNRRSGAHPPQCDRDKVQWHFNTLEEPSCGNLWQGKLQHSAVLWGSMWGSYRGRGGSRSTG